MPNAQPRPLLTRRALCFGLSVAGLTALPALLPWPATAQDAPDVPKMAADAAFRAAQAGEILLIDIRRPDEWRDTGVAEGAIGLDMTQDAFIEQLVALRQARPNTPLALICRSGNRSGYVTQALAERGFPGLIDVAEGMAGGPNGPGWLERALPVHDGSAEAVSARTQAVLP